MVDRVRFALQLIRAQESQRAAECGRRHGDGFAETGFSEGVGWAVSFILLAIREDSVNGS